MESEMREQSIQRDRRKTEEILALEAKRGDREARNILYVSLHDVIASRTRPAKRLLARLLQASGPIEDEDIDQQAFVIFCDLLDE
jgi:hypothetical protein